MKKIKGERVFERGDIIEVTSGTSRYYGETGTVIGTKNTSLIPKGVEVSFGRGIIFNRRDTLPPDWIREIEGDEGE